MLSRGADDSGSKQDQRQAMTYFSEFRVNWRALGAASIGIAAGYGINNYLNNVFIPPLMEEFGWQSSDIALLGTAAVLSIVCQPIAGRITDRLGVRAVATFGVSGAVITYILLGLMSGSFIEYFAINTAQIAFISATTGPVVYSRLIAQSFDRARGVALAIAMAAPSVAGAVFVSVLASFIEREGWRMGYFLTAGCAGVAGAIAIVLIPRTNAPNSATEPMGTGKTTLPLRQIVRNPAFALIVGGIMLCSLTIVMQTTQLGVILGNAGISRLQVSFVISVYAIGVIVGRLLCGAALDRFSSNIVAAVALGLPAVGLTILSSGFPSLTLMSVAVLFLGLSLGAEGDIGGFLAMSYFESEVYSTVFGIIIGSLALSSAIGSLILSFSLRLTGSFAPFLLLAAGSALIGALLFYRLGRVPTQDRKARDIHENRVESQ